MLTACMHGRSVVTLGPQLLISFVESVSLLQVNDFLFQ